MRSMIVIDAERKRCIYGGGGYAILSSNEISTNLIIIYNFVTRPSVADDIL